jgi:hypothetical protein
MTTHADLLARLWLKERVFGYSRNDVESYPLLLHHDLEVVVVRVVTWRQQWRAECRILAVRQHGRVEVRGDVVARLFPDLDTTQSVSCFQGVTL